MGANKLRIEAYFHSFLVSSDLSWLVGSFLLARGVRKLNQFLSSRLLCFSEAAAANKQKRRHFCLVIRSLALCWPPSVDRLQLIDRPTLCFLSFFSPKISPESLAGRCFSDAALNTKCLCVSTRGKFSSLIEANENPHYCCYYASRSLY